MSDLPRNKAVPVAIKPIEIVVNLPVPPAGVPLVSRTFRPPLGAIRHLMSDKPLRPPFRGEQRPPQRD